jgi:predicted nuclease of predicted toxin-antitoxin system
MKFLCDVHISLKTVKFLISKGYECVHINTILDKWFTKDTAIAKYVDENDFVLVTKDADFRDSFFLKNSPKKLVKINLGNISNLELIKIIDSNLDKIEQLNTNESFIIEIDIESVTFSLMKIVL